MRRTIAIGLLSFGTLFGYGAGIFELVHAHHRGACAHACPHSAAFFHAEGDPGER
jgi:hypothetical protein